MNHEAKNKSRSISQPYPDGEASSLDTEEIFGHYSPSLTYRNFRSEPIKDDLRAAETLYVNVSGILPVSTVERFKSCRTFAWFAKSSLNSCIRVISNACKLRWCPFCASAKSRHVSEQVIAWCKKCRSPKMITLTMRHSPASLQSQIDELYKAFRKLRRYSIFRKKCHSGIWFFQVCKSHDGDNWHPHIHMLVDGAYFDHGELSKLWYASTGHSYIVDVRKVRDPKKAAEYVARYVARPAVLTDYDKNDQEELFFACHNRRLAGTWGSAREVRFSQVNVSDREHFIKIGRWSDVLRQLSHNKSALKVYQAWKSGEPLYADIRIIETDKFWPKKEREPYFSLTEDLIIDVYGSS